jgi:hypothetical protein
MNQTTTRAALALALVCALGACNREDQAEKQPLKDTASAPPAAATKDLAAWDVQLDDPGAGGFQMTEQPGGGWLVNSTSASGLTWRDGDIVDGGDFQASGTFSAPATGGGADGYGIFVGGRHLKDPDRVYTAFLVRPDGKYEIVRREGASHPTLVDWTETPAIHQSGHGGETAQNTLEVRVDTATAHFLVNGTEVKSLPNDQAQPYGNAGLRLGKGADLTVSAFTTHGQTGANGTTAVPRAAPDSQAPGPR